MLSLPAPVSTSPEMPTERPVSTSSCAYSFTALIARSIHSDILLTGSFYSFCGFADIARGIA